MKRPERFDEMVAAAAAGDVSLFAELEHEYLASRLPRQWQDERERWEK